MPSTVIVDELLCFLASKQDYVSCEELVSLCVKTFTDVNIKESKLTLFATCERGPDDQPPVVGVKFRNCRGPNSAENNVKDMLALFNELGNRAPKFAAIDLNAIPLVSADKIDVNGLLATLTRLTNEVQRMSQAMLRQDETIGNLQRAVVDCCNAKPATYADKTKSGNSTPNNSRPPNRRSSSVDPENPVSIPNTENPKRNDDKNRENEEEWNETVYNKRSRKRRQFKSGKSVTNVENRDTGVIGIKRVKRAELFVTRLSPGCTTDDVKNFIFGNLELEANVTKISNTRNAAYFSSFHVSCECTDPSVFYNENLWPEHVLYRRWYPPRTARSGVGVLNAGS